MSKHSGSGRRFRKALRDLAKRLSQERQKVDLTVDQRTKDIAVGVARDIGKEISCILYYPHLIPKEIIPYPFTRGGIVVVFTDDVTSTVDLILRVYAHIPPDISVHCLRRAELFELSLPSFTWLDMVNKYLYLPFLLKNNSAVLYGRDIRHEIDAPDNAAVLLNLHLEVCRHFIRNHLILGWLHRRLYVELIKKLEWQMTCLMATALLIHNEWNANLEKIPERFMVWYPDPEISQIFKEYGALRNLLNATTDERSHRQYAFEAVWLFEMFLRKLQGYAI